MRRFLIIIALAFTTNAVNAGWFSDDDLFVGFWKQYSMSKNGILSDPRHAGAGGYMDIKKSDNSYVITIYMVGSTTNDFVTGYQKREFTGSLKGDNLLLTELLLTQTAVDNPMRVNIFIHSENNGKSMKVIMESIKESWEQGRYSFNYERTDEDKAIEDIKAKENNDF